MNRYVWAKVLTTFENAWKAGWLFVANLESEM